MKTKSLLSFIVLPAFLATVFFSSCDRHRHTETPPMSTALYDTLGWFIQGAQGTVANQGTKMIEDPDNKGTKIQAGRLAIRTVVNKALMIIAADPKLQPYFPTLLSEVKDGNKTGLSKLLQSFTDFVQQGVSGQKVYKGPDMKKVHNHASYSRFGSKEIPTADSASFDQFVTDVAAAAKSLKVPGSVIAQLGKLLYSTEGDVVQDHRPNVASTPLYDTLGWFIQGANSSMPIETQGTKLIDDPANQGKKIQAGRLAIRTVVDSALMVIAADKRLSKYFPTLLNEVGNGNTTGLAKLLNSFTDFVQQGVSGQKVYHGLSMKKAHNHATYDRFGSKSTPVVANSNDFNIFVGDIAKAAQDLKVPNSIIAQLGTLLNSTKKDIVQ